VIDDGGLFTPLENRQGLGARPLWKTAAERQRAKVPFAKLNGGNFDGDARGWPAGRFRKLKQKPR
jgi:hypothetical protein